MNARFWLVAMLVMAAWVTGSGEALAQAAGGSWESVTTEGFGWLEAIALIFFTVVVIVAVVGVMRAFWEPMQALLGVLIVAVLLVSAVVLSVLRDNAVNAVVG